MKTKIIILAATLFSFSAALSADDRPVSFENLPDAAKTFIRTNYPDVAVQYTTKDDDLFKPDYHAALFNGVILEFYNDGSIKKIESFAAGISESLIPSRIRDYVKTHYPGTRFVEYEVDRKAYEVKLSNRMELTFTKDFHLIEIDD